jgi:hypothetical protein
MAISEFLIDEGISKAKALDEKLIVVAKAVGRYIDIAAESLVYELEVARAIEDLRTRKIGSLNESDHLRLSKPARNSHYHKFGVQSITLRDAIALTLRGMQPIRPFEMRYGRGSDGQTLSNRVILYKEDEKLKQHIYSRLSVSPIVLYSFQAPETLLH